MQNETDKVGYGEPSITYNEFTQNPGHGLEDTTIKGPLAQSQPVYVHMDNGTTASITRQGQSGADNEYKVELSPSYPQDINGAEGTRLQFNKGQLEKTGETFPLETGSGDEPRTVKLDASRDDVAGILFGANELKLNFGQHTGAETARAGARGTREL